VRILREGDPIDAILESDAVISATSTVGFEACALDRPAVILAFPGVEIPDAYEEFGAALLVRDGEDAAEALVRLINDSTIAERLQEGRHRLIDQMFAGLVPGAAKRAVSALAAVAQSRSS
jgi:CDP-glycerol glycerophosphotransferase (TagB/SpsB family)